MIYRRPEKSVDDILEQSKGQVSKLIREFQQIKPLTNDIKSFLEPIYREFIISAGLHKGIATISLEHTEILSLLRFQQSELLSFLRTEKKWYKIRTIRWKIKTNHKVHSKNWHNNTKKRIKPKITADKISSTISQASESISDEKLKKALESLAKKIND